MPRELSEPLEAGIVEAAWSMTEVAAKCPRCDALHVGAVSVLVLTNGNVALKVMVKDPDQPVVAGATHVILTPHDLRTLRDDLTEALGLVGGEDEALG